MPDDDANQGSGLMCNDIRTGFDTEANAATYYIYDNDILQHYWKVANFNVSDIQANFVVLDSDTSTQNQEDCSMPGREFSAENSFQCINNFPSENCVSGQITGEGYIDISGSSPCTSLTDLKDSSGENDEKLEVAIRSEPTTEDTGSFSTPGEIIGYLAPKYDADPGLTFTCNNTYPGNTQYDPGAILISIPDKSESDNLCTGNIGIVSSTDNSFELKHVTCSIESNCSANNRERTITSLLNYQDVQYSEGDGGTTSCFKDADFCNDKLIQTYADPDDLQSNYLTIVGYQYYYDTNPSSEQQDLNPYYSGTSYNPEHWNFERVNNQPGCNIPLDCCFDPADTDDSTCSGLIKNTDACTASVCQSESTDDIFFT